LKLRNLLIIFIVSAVIWPASQIFAASTGSIKITASTKVTSYGKQITIAGTLQGLAGKTVSLQYRTPSSKTYQELVSLTTDANGNFGYAFGPRQNYYYKAYFAGDGTYPAKYSNSTLVQIKPLITAKATEGKRLLRRKNKKIGVGRKFIVSGHLYPSLKNAKVLLQVYKTKVKKYVTYKVARSNSKADFRFRNCRVSSDDPFKYRVMYPSTTNYRSGVSANFTLLGYYINPYKVSAAYSNFIVIDRRTYMLYYVKYGKTVRSFKCIVGQPGYPTPGGNWSIVSKQVNPTWYNPHKDWSAGMPESIPGGPGNPLGVRGMFLSADQIIIHGNNNEGLFNDKVRAYSHGCIRMKNAEIVWLYARIPVGANVKIL